MLPARRKAIAKLTIFIYMLRLVNPEAGSGNRTRMISLEGWSFTIKLYPRLLSEPYITLNIRQCKTNFYFSIFFFIFHLTFLLCENILRPATDAGVVQW